MPSYIRNAPFTSSWRESEHRQMCTRRRWARRLRRRRRTNPEITWFDLWLEDVRAGRA